jgi:hypothetical protein
MPSPRTVVPLPDYERIFRVIYSVLDGHVNTPHACVFFAVIGASILELKYKIAATPVAGAAAFGVFEPTAAVSTFGNFVDGELVSSEKAFHCWVESNGIILDFMAPLYRESLRTFGHNIPVSRRMFQKPLREMAPSVNHLEAEGSFFVRPNSELSKALFSSFFSRPMATDLANVCLSWYRRPPKALVANMAMRDDRGALYPLQLKGPTLTGAW